VVALRSLQHDEEERLQALHDLAVLDSPPEPLFDALVRAAAEVAGRPISLISLIDDSRQWFKANVGLPGVSETPREHAFCEHVVRSGSVVEVPDARFDERFSANPLVVGGPKIRAYTGIPIQMANGVTLGALCVVDSQPGKLTPMQVKVLTQLGQAASLALQQRAELIRQREAALNETREARLQTHLAEALGDELRSTQQFLERSGQVAGVGGWEVDIATNLIRWSAQTCRIHDLAPGYEPTLDEALAFFAPEAADAVMAAWNDAVASNTPWDLVLPMVTAKGRSIWVRTVGAIEQDSHGKAMKLAGAIQDITDRRRAIAALEASEHRFRKLFQYSLGLICTHELDGTLLSVNPSAAASLGYEVSDMMGRNLADFLPAGREDSLARYLESIQKHGVETGIMQLSARDGTVRYWRFQNVLDTDADEPYVVGHAQDVTEQQNYERTLLEWSTMDPLTRAMNRRYLADLEKTMTAGRGWACLVVDIDHFKQINDTYGHKRGDDVLVEVADLLRHAAGPRDVVVRLGGDEFLVSIEDPATLTQVRDRAIALQAERSIALSLGTASRHADESLDTVIARADEQLYAHRSKVRQGTR
jgi:diguanylate cyclase (GGDEF)-like protein/PAS domain S-box-containing protein